MYIVCGYTVICFMFQDVRLGLDSILLDPGPRGLVKNGVGCRLHPKEEPVIASMDFFAKNHRKNSAN